MTLGEVETDIVERLNKVLLQIIEHEENARGMLLEKKPKIVFNLHWPRLRHPGQRPQHHLQRNDEPAFLDAAGS